MGQSLSILQGRVGQSLGILQGRVRQSLAILQGRMRCVEVASTQPSSLRWVAEPVGLRGLRAAFYMQDTRDQTLQDGATLWPLSGPCGRHCGALSHRQAVQTQPIPFRTSGICCLLCHMRRGGEGARISVPGSSYRGEEFRLLTSAVLQQR